MRILSEDACFIQCAAGYACLAVVITMQQAKGTGVIISVRGNDTMMTMRAHNYILDLPAEDRAP